MESWAGRPGIRPRCGSAVRLVESCRPRPDERGLHTPPAKTTRRGAIHELVGVAGPLPARSPLPPRQLPERKAVLCVDLEYLLVFLYVLVDEWCQETHPPTPKQAGRPPSLSASEVLTLAVLAQWPRWRSERDFWRFADVHLRGYFPNLLSHGQLNAASAPWSPSYGLCSGTWPER